MLEEIQRNFEQISLLPQLQELHFDNSQIQ
jgi:hypothetical protein